MLIRLGCSADTFVPKEVTAAAFFFFHFILFRGAISCSQYGEKCNNGKNVKNYTYCLKLYALPYVCACVRSYVLHLVLCTLNRVHDTPYFLTF